MRNVLHTIKCTYLKVSIPRSFDISIVMEPSLDQVTDTSHPPSRSPLASFPQDLDQLTVATLGLFLEKILDMNHREGSLCFWFLSLNTVLQFIMLLSALISCSFLLLSSSPLYGVATGHYLPDLLTFGIFPAGGAYKQLLLRTFACGVGFLWGKHLGMALLAHLVTVCFHFNSLKFSLQFLKPLQLPWSF